MDKRIKSNSSDFCRRASLMNSDWWYIAANVRKSSVGLFLCVVGHSPWAMAWWSWLFSHACPSSDTPKRPRAAVTHLGGDLWDCAGLRSALEAEIVYEESGKDAFLIGVLRFNSIFLSAQQMSLFSWSLNTPSSSWFTNITSRTWVTCGNRVTGLCGPSFRFGRVGGPSAFLHYTSLYNACRKISAEESGTKGRVRVSVRAVLCGFCGVTYVFYILIIVLNDCTC